MKEKDFQSNEVELTEDVAQGEYSNMAVVVHSPSEFVLDFIRIMPGLNKAKVKSRVILTPDVAKQLLHILNDNIKVYEENFGKISFKMKEEPIIGMKGDA